MLDLYHQIENLIKEEATNAIDVTTVRGVLISEDGKTVIPSSYEDLKKLTNRNDFCEPVLYRIPEEFYQEYKEHERKGNIIEMINITIAHGIPFSREDSEMFEASMLLVKKNRKMAQLIMDQFYSGYLRNKYYPSFLERVSNSAYRNKMIENASKPRNKFYDQAMKLLKNTWDKYPGAGKKIFIQKRAK